MPTSFQTLVENYIGQDTTNVSTSMLSEWLTASARKILHLLPDHILEKYASKTSITFDTTSLAEYRLLNIMHGSKVCKKIAMSEEAQVKDSASSKYATAYSPVYLLRDGVVRVYPAGANATGTVLMEIEAVTVTNGGTGYVVGDTFTAGNLLGSVGAQIIVTSIDEFGSITGVDFISRGSYSTIVGIQFSLDVGGAETEPRNPIGAEFSIDSFAVKGVTIVNQGTLYSSDNSPGITFSGGGGSAAAGTISVSASTGGVTGVTITNSGTGYTSKPTIAFTGNSGYAFAIAYPTVTYDATSITDFPATLYPAVAIDTAVVALIKKTATSIKKLFDLTWPTITPPSLSYTAGSVTAAAADSLDISAITLSDFPTITFDSDLTTAITAIKTALDTDQDVELAEGNVIRAKNLLEKYASEIQYNVQGYTKALEIYRMKIQVALQNSKALTEVSLANASTATQVSLANSKNTIEKYMAEVQAYAQQIQDAGTKFTSLLQKTNVEAQGNVALIPLLKNEFNEIIQAYIR